MSSNRRDFFTKLSSLSASIFAGRNLLSAQAKGPQTGMGQMDLQHRNRRHPTSPQPSTQVRVAPGTNRSASAAGSVPVVTPNISDLPFTMDGGVKVFKLI